MLFKSKTNSLGFLYVGLLLLGSVVPIGNQASDILMDNYTLDIRWDYLLHALIYLPLPLILFYGRRSIAGSGAIRLIFLSVFIPVLFEILQMVIPYRSFNINDMMANCFGVVLGWVLVLVLRKSRLSS